MTKDKILNSFDVKKDLAPNFWTDDNKLNPKIRETLLRVAHDFMDQTNIDWSNLVDIILTGSIANYTWSSYSDIDLHIIVDFEKFDIPTDLLWDYLSVKKEQWNNIHADLLVYNYPVEIYVEDKNEYAGSTGVYSILNDEWIKTPTQEKAEISIDKDKIKRVAKKWIKAILFYKKKAYENNDVTILEDTQEKLKRIFTILRGKRSSGLATPEKEMSFGNLLWKCLKRLGLIAEIWNTNYYIYDKLNSIREKLNEKLLSFEDTESENNDLENLTKVSEVAARKKWFDENCEIANVDKDLPKNSIIRIKRKGRDMWDYKPLKGNWNFMRNDGSYKIISPDIWFTGAGRFEDGRADVYYLDNEYITRNNIIDANGQFLLEDDPVQIIKNIRFVDNPYLKTYSSIQNRVTAMIETGIPLNMQTSNSTNSSSRQTYIDFIDENNKRIRPKIDTSKMNYNDSWKISSYFTRNMYIQPNIIPVLIYALNDENQSAHQYGYHYVGDIIYLGYKFPGIWVPKPNKGLILDTNGNLYNSLEEASEGMCKELGYNYDPGKIEFGSSLGFKY